MNPAGDPLLCSHIWTFTDFIPGGQADSVRRNCGASHSDICAHTCTFSRENRKNFRVQCMKAASITPITLHTRIWFIPVYLILTHRSSADLIRQDWEHIWKTACPLTDGLWQRSLTGGLRSGSGPRSLPVRTRTYSQNRRFWFKTWRGASICNRRGFCSLYCSGLADEEMHRPIACELSHPTWYYSANQVCAFQAVNIAVQTDEIDRGQSHMKRR